MSLSSSSQLAPSPAVIINPRFCSPKPVDLTFFTKAPWFMPGEVTVADINGDAVLIVKDCTRTMRGRMIVLDGSGEPVISMRQKLSSLHGRWQMFRGSSEDPKDLLFTVKRSSEFYLKTKLDVFLASNSKEEMVDFTVNGSYREKSCTVCKGDSSRVVAQMSEEYKTVNNSALSFSKNKHSFGVAVDPNMDFCFVAALIVIRHQIAKEDKELIAVSSVSGLVVGLSSC